MNGFNKLNAPSLNGLKRSDGVGAVQSTQGLVGKINFTTNDTGSFFYTTQDDDKVILNTPFTTIENGAIDTLSTAKNFQANEVETTKVTTDRLFIGETEFLSGGNTNPSWGPWQFQLHPDGHLNVMKGNKAYFRYFGNDINIFSRISLFDTTQNGKWSITKG